MAAFNMRNLGNMEMSPTTEMNLSLLSVLASVGAIGLTSYMATLDWSHTHDASSNFAYNVELLPVAALMMTIAAVLFALNALGKKSEENDKAFLKSERNGLIGQDEQEKLKEEANESKNDLTSIGDMGLPHLFLALGMTAITAFVALGFMHDSLLFTHEGDRSRDAGAACLLLVLAASTLYAYLKALPTLKGALSYLYNKSGKEDFRTRAGLEPTRI